MPTRYYWLIALIATVLLFGPFTNSDGITTLTVVFGVGGVSLMAVGKRWGPIRV